MNLCLEFQEAYKRLDNLCRDCFRSNDGVTEYIKQMEYVFEKGEESIPDWTRRYKTLKHLRYIRNKLSHEVGTLSSGICTENDYNDVIDFYNLMMDMKDPLTVYYTDCNKKKKAASGAKKSDKNKTEKHEKAVCSGQRDYSGGSDVKKEEEAQYLFSDEKASLNNASNAIEKGPNTLFVGEITENNDGKKSENSGLKGFFGKIKEFFND